MTIIEELSCALKKSKTGMTSMEIYKEIVEEDLCTFGAKNPVSVVNNQIRRRCIGLGFPTAYLQKQFEIVGYKGKNHYDNKNDSEGYIIALITKK